MKVRLPIPGYNIEAEVKSNEECAKPDVIRVANTKADHDKRIATGGIDIPGTKGGFFCKLCNEEIVLAPSGQQIEAIGGDYICSNCFKVMIEKPYV